MLTNEYSVKSLCEIMNISKSGYYKWLKTKDTLNMYEINRRDLGEVIKIYIKENLVMVIVE